MADAQGAGQERWLARALARPRALPVIVLVAVALMLPALTVGFVLDDKFHQVMVRGDDGFEGLERAPHELYELSGRAPELRAERRAGGSMPWYTARGFRVNFLRPVTSWTLYADHALSPHSAVPGHVQSIVWLVVLLLILTAVYRRVVPHEGAGAAWIAMFAVLLYAIDDGHAMSIGWIANRNAPVATCFAALTLLFHLRWRQDGGRGSAVLAALSLAVGLLAGEMALTAVAYVAAYALFLDEDRPRRRLLSLVPYALVFLAWRVAYGALGYGAHGSTYYVDPGDDPVRFVIAAAQRLPLLLAGELTPVPADLGDLLGRSAAPVHLAIALALLGLIAAASWRWVRASAVARFAAAGMVLSAVPLCSAGASNRLLLPVAIGGALFLAGFLAWVRQTRPRWPVRWVGGFLVVTHLVLSPLLLPLRTLELGLYDRAYVEGARSLDRVDLADRTLVIVNGPDFFFTWWAPVFRFSEGRSVPPRLRVLGDASGAVEVTRVDDRTLRLRAARGFAGHSLGPIVMDPRDPIAVGYVHTVGDLTVTVIDLTPDGRPATIECRFSSPLEDESRQFVAWTRDGYRRFALPPVGGTAVTEDVSRADALAYRYR